MLHSIVDTSVAENMKKQEGQTVSTRKRTALGKALAAKHLVCSCEHSIPAPLGNSYLSALYKRITNNTVVKLETKIIWRAS